MKIGRNDPCPCGSGKKYKQCCINKQKADPVFDYELPPTLMEQQGTPNGATDLLNEFRMQLNMQGELTADEVEQFAMEYNHRINAQPLDDFLGLSPEQMNQLLYGDPDQSTFPVQFCPENLTESDVLHTPIIEQLTFLAGRMAETGSLPLTGRGFLKRALAREIHAKFTSFSLFINEKLRSADDSLTVSMLAALGEIAGLFQFKKTAVHLNKPLYQKMKNDPVGFYMEMVDVFVNRYNWLFYSRYEEQCAILQKAYLFDLYILHKKARHFISGRELEKIYAAAFPMAVTDPHNPFSMGTGFMGLFLERFTALFGLTEFEVKREEIIPEYFWRVTPLFDKLLDWQNLDTNETQTGSKVIKFPADPHQAAAGDSETGSSGRHIVRFKIQLKGIQPPVWRSFSVDSAVTLHELHNIIQTVMGWLDMHLYSFSINGTGYALPDEDDILFDVDAQPSDATTVEELLDRQNSPWLYTYDFGDNWEHIITIEEITPHNGPLHTARCLDGARNCPPEDCGSVSGYEQLLHSIKNPDSEAAQSYLDWLEEDYDPEHFDQDEINEMLRHPDVW